MGISFLRIIADGSVFRTKPNAVLAVCVDAMRETALVQTVDAPESGSPAILLLVIASQTYRSGYENPLTIF